MEAPTKSIAKMEIIPVGEESNRVRSITNPISLLQVLPSSITALDMFPTHVR